MKVAYIERTGPAHEVLQVGELDDPRAGPGQVLVRIRASGINPSDVKSRAGASGRPPFEGKRIIHNDGAGEIVAVGDGIDEARIGERIWLHNTNWATQLGTAATLVAAPAEDAEPLLDDYGFDEGACFGVPLLTAYQGVALGGSVEDATVLVTGGAGAVGHHAIQIARRKGARVIATVSSDAKAQVARLAGADHVLNYRSDDLPAAVADLTQGRGVDHCIEVNLSANGHLRDKLRGSGGRIAVYGSDDAVAAFDSRTLRMKQVSMHFYNVYALPPAVLRAAKADLAQLLAQQRIETRIAARFTLEQIVDAHEAQESGQLIGNIVVDTG